MRTLRAARCLSIVALSLTAGPLLAQSSVTREAVLALHDSAASADTATLAALRAAPGQEQDKEVQRLRQAFLLLRQGELDSSAKTLRKAGEEFFNVTSRHDDWPLAWYGIGLTERALARGKFPVLPTRFHPLGADHNQGAIQAFVYALQKDGNFLPAAEGLADAVQATTRWGYTGKARDALRRTAVSSAQVLLVRARLEREDNDHERAIKLFERALQLGSDSGVTYLELAREQFAIGQDSQAIASYWEGVRVSHSAAAVQMLHDQLGLIATPGELRGFDSLSTSARAERIRGFWTIRDVNAGVASGERLKEHYNRYEKVNLAFRTRSRGMTPVARDRATRMAAVFGYGETPTTASYNRGFSGFYNVAQPPYSPEESRYKSDFGLDEAFTVVRQGRNVSYSSTLGSAFRTANARSLAGDMLDEIDEGGTLIDSRGIAYLRYGKPDAVAGNLWVYHRPEGDIAIPVNGNSPGSACAVVNEFCGVEMRGYLKQEEAYAIRNRLRAARDTINSTDRLVRPFEGDLSAAVDAYAMVDGGTGEGKILVALAVPARQIKPDSTYNGFVYPVRIQLIAAPPSGAYRVERDTTRYFVTDRRLRDDEYLQTTEILPVAPANYHLRVVVQTVDGHRGSVGGDDTVDVRSVRRGVALSDIVLGRESSGLTWWSGSERLNLNPSGRIKRDETLHLFYQLGGLPLGRPFRTSLEVYHATSPKDKPLISLSYDEIADQPVMEIQRLVNLAQLDRGVHTIRVTITDEDGNPIAQRHASVRID